MIRLLLYVLTLSHLQAAEGDITWLVEYEGSRLPEAPWTAVGKPKAVVAEGSLHLNDDGQETGCYRADWSLTDPDAEIIVEATVKTGAITGSMATRPATYLWPWRHGAPVMLQVSDGRHQEGLVLFPAQATNFTNRYIPMDTGAGFHTYRLIIRGQDMQMLVDGAVKVTGQGAFWKPAETAQPFIQFGSTAKTPAGEAWWKAVRLGVRKNRASPPAVAPVSLSRVGAWDIPRAEVRQTRPYLYDMGQGLLLMSVAQGPEAIYEPFGLLKSTDAGKTWAPIPGLDKVDTAPLPCVRRADGTILAVSRWTRTRPDGSVVGKTVRLNADATAYTMADNRIILPQQYTTEAKGDQVICERHLWNDPDGGLTLAVWSRKSERHSDGSKTIFRHAHLLRSVDEGRTWNHFSTIGPGGEPAVVRLGGQKLTAVVRNGSNSCLQQMFSHNGGRSWTQPITLEVGRVMPDLLLMRNGVLACSYGRPASCLMFSLDGGKTWPSHHVISDKAGFNCSSMVEVSPGRLLYVHDAPALNAVVLDVATHAPVPAGGP